ncbi:MAG TPA: serine/threonine-protein kinase [Pirellulales bacterium]|jgi:serine/threonine-protein kinase
MALGFLRKLGDMFKDRRIDVAERFELLREAISGTMSSFYMARDKKTGKTVGLKLLDPEKTEAFEARFKVLKKPSEGQIAMSLNHPRIVETYEAGLTKDGKQYLVMEFVNGQGMHAVLKNENEYLDGKRLNLFRQMAEAIDAVHRAGYIHRDICPRNFIVADNALSLKLIDFGLTLPMKREYMLPGNRTGTPLYMAPEIVRRKATDQRVDLFSLGVTAYQMWTFTFPWPSSDSTGTGALQHDSRAPTPITELRPRINRNIARTIMQCIEADPGKRPESAEAVINMLRKVTKDDA